jgi:hypothetical protein
MVRENSTFKPDYFLGGLPVVRMLDLFTQLDNVRVE